MSENEEGANAGCERKRGKEMAGEENEGEREVRDCFTNRIPLINHPV